MWASQRLAVEVNLTITPLDSQFTSTSSVSLVRPNNIFLPTHRATETPGSLEGKMKGRKKGMMGMKVMVMVLSLEMMTWVSSAYHPENCLYHAPNKYFLQAELSHQRQRAIWNGVSATPLGDLNKIRIKMIENI